MYMYCTSGIVVTGRPQPRLCCQPEINALLMIGPGAVVCFRPQDICNLQETVGKYPCSNPGLYRRDHAQVIFCTICHHG
jgi:hypothetical protein